MLALVFLAIFGLDAEKNPASPSTGRYPRGELLVEPEELAKATSRESLVIIDARARRDFESARIPGARWVDANAWARAFGDGKDAAEWSRRIGALGIGTKAKVVVYDQTAPKDAARMWWILRYWGVEEARLLDGGFAAWRRAGLPVEEQPPAEPPPVRFEAKPRAARLATKGLLLESLKSGSLQIVDARSEGEFCGTVKLNNKRSGAIPGALHLDWIDLLDAETHRFKAAAELEKVFAAAGIDIKKPTAAHCQSGGRSSVMVFALELMGAEEPRNYYASWAEWSSAAETPVVDGKPKPQEKR
jgi:thiosulfate/3-mercaptopyruvate sulfurtransferase